MFKVKNRNTRKRCEICSKLPIKTPARRQWCRSVVFIVTFEHISLIEENLRVLAICETWMGLGVEEREVSPEVEVEDLAHFKRELEDTKRA